MQRTVLTTTVLLVLLLSPVAFVNANSETSRTLGQPSEVITIRQATAEASSAFDTAEAINTVTQEPAFSTATNQMQWSLANVGYDWMLNDGAPKLTDVELFFLLSNQTGPVGWLVATMTPNLENLLSFSSEGAMYHYTVSYSYAWAGYEFYNSKTPRQTPIYESTQSWTIPSVSEPWSGACSNFVCDYSVWAGLTDQAGGGTSGQSGYGIVQAGFDSCLGSTYWLGQACNGKSFVGWYEVFPAATQFPTNFNTTQLKAPLRKSCSAAQPSWDNPSRHTTQILHGPRRRTRRKRQTMKTNFAYRAGVFRIGRKNSSSQC